VAEKAVACLWKWRNDRVLTVKWASAHFFFALPFPERSFQGRGIADMNGLESQVHRIAESIAKALRLEIVEVECHGKGAKTIVRVIVEKEGGVGIQDCEQFHHSLGRALDVTEPVSHAYRLEVSSPGLDRPLKQRKDYDQAVGLNIRVKVHDPIQGKGTFVGQLAEVDDRGITLQVPVRKSRTHRRVALEWDTIAQAKREIEW
jgi:ribosome maturation factor RimP